MNDHCVLDYAHQPPVFRCLGCADIHEVQLPMAINELVSLSDQFMARHKANHIQVVYAPDRAGARKALYAKAAALNELGVKVALCGKV